jgi:enoyl-CoA hydratase/carnithine racemase
VSASRKPAIVLARDEHVVTLTLDRPEVLNAYDRQMRDEIFGALEWLHDEPEVSVLIVRGNGRAFSTGGDLREFGTAPSPVRAREVRQMRDVWRLWSTLPCVAIAAVHGYAAGGGLEMALLCDLIVCTTDARFGLPETGLGLIPGVGGTQTLPRAIGLGRAAAMLLGGEWLDGRAAVRCGLALSAVAPSRLDRSARALARRIARIEPALLRAAKESVRRGLDVSLAEGLGLERRLGYALGPSAE